MLPRYISNNRAILSPSLFSSLAFKDVFKAGCSLYGVADLSALAADTHKFESRYLDGLVGPYKTDEDKEL